ncbi:MAG: ABC transporter transmembrane domain-containing protein, partial [Chloroflexota bacterium]|nr:ABC transporter transmembrane domain-containing protein [Chloroflexota bacterium]
ARVDARTMLGFLEHLLSLPYRFFAQRSSGDLLLRLNSNAAIREALTGQTLSVLLDGTLVFGYLAVLLARDTLFGGLVLAIALLQVALVLATGRRMHDLTQRDLMAQAMSQGYLVEALTGIATVRRAARSPACWITGRICSTRRLRWGSDGLTWRRWWTRRSGHCAWPRRWPCSGLARPAFWMGR